jgi:hypothetical protein
MKGEMPVPYIVALILAAIVLGLIIFWFVTSGGDFFSTVSEGKCKAKLMEVCLGKSGDYSINPSQYSECKGTDLANTVSSCGDV